MARARESSIAAFSGLGLSKAAQKEVLGVQESLMSKTWKFDLSLIMLRLGGSIKVSKMAFKMSLVNFHIRS